MTDEKNILGIVGLCRAAGKIVIGVPMICDALKKKSERGDFRGEVNVIVIEASDTSQNTHKRITDRCAYYNVKHVRISSDCEALARAVGKSGAVAAVAINDASFCRALLMKLS
ncbi:MAG: hypothetical protein E7649_02530 [Ruminococcaceae bacterium]|nr:hypothetical protein [Oscillospiraceae bacterium]